MLYVRDLFRPPGASRLLPHPMCNGFISLIDGENSGFQHSHRWPPCKGLSPLLQPNFIQVFLPIKTYIGMNWSGIHRQYLLTSQEERQPGIMHLMEDAPRPMESFCWKKFFLNQIKPLGSISNLQEIWKTQEHMKWYSRNGVSRSRTWEIPLDKWSGFLDKWITSEGVKRDTETYRLKKHTR